MNDRMGFNWPRLTVLRRIDIQQGAKLLLLSDDEPPGFAIASAIPGDDQIWMAQLAEDGRDMAFYRLEEITAHQQLMRLDGPVITEIPDLKQLRPVDENEVAENGPVLSFRPDKPEAHILFLTASRKFVSVNIESGEIVPDRNALKGVMCPAYRLTALVNPESSKQPHPVVVERT